MSMPASFHNLEGWLSVYAIWRELSEGCVLALVILSLGVSAGIKTPKDIFPSIDIPVVPVIWDQS
jgi:multidrug efflux pump subunit AcrB